MLIRVIRGVLWGLLLLFAFGCAFLFLRLKVLELMPVRSVFIDGGAHLGETLTDFRLSALRHWHAWDVYAFEANPALIPEITRFPHVHIVDKAIWTEDGSVEFFVGATTQSSSILGHKSTGDLARAPIRVPSVDFGRWLRDNVTRDDYVMVKLDIEGAEYAVLDKMLLDGSVELVDKFLIEFHNKKVGVSAARDAEIMAALAARGIEAESGYNLPSGAWFWP